MNFESKLCRVCLECDENDSFINIFINGEEIPDKIYLISAIKVITKS